MDHRSAPAPHRAISGNHGPHSLILAWFLKVLLVFLAWLLKGSQGIDTNVGEREIHHHRKAGISLISRTCGLPNLAPQQPIRARSRSYQIAQQLSFDPKGTFSPSDSSELTWDNIVQASYWMIIDCIEALNHPEAFLRWWLCPQRTRLPGGGGPADVHRSFL